MDDGDFALLFRISFLICDCYPHTPKNKSVCEIMTFATLMKYKYILVEVRRFNTIIAKLETYSHGVRLVILD